MRLLTPDKLRSILEDPANSTLGGHALDLTCICADINNFCAGPGSLNAPKVVSRDANRGENTPTSGPKLKGAAAHD